MTKPRKALIKVKIPLIDGSTDMIIEQKFADVRERTADGLVHKAISEPDE